MLAISMTLMALLETALSIGDGMFIEINAYNVAPAASRKLKWRSAASRGSASEAPALCIDMRGDRRRPAAAAALRGEARKNGDR